MALLSLREELFQLRTARSGGSLREREARLHALAIVYVESRLSLAIWDDLPEIELFSIPGSRSDLINLHGWSRASDDDPMPDRLRGLMATVRDYLIREGIVVAVRTHEELCPEGMQLVFHLVATRLAGV